LIAGRFRAALLAGMVLGLAACGDDSETEAEAAGPVNRPPAIEGKPARTVIAGEAYSFVPTASDPDGDPIRFGIDGLPKWLTFNATTGRLTGSPQAADVGIHRGIVVWVSDGKVESLLPPLEIEVLPAGAPVNRAPQISGTPGNAVIAGTFYEFLPTASDADGDRLSFTIENLPRWAGFEPAIGRVYGTPAIGDLGLYTGIVIRVSDGAATNALGPFAVIVNPPPAQNRAPVISGIPDPTVLVGQGWSFQPSAADPDGDPLSFQVFGAPAWMHLDNATGLLSGTPEAAHVGTQGGIQVIVTDGQASAALPSFSVEVISPNLPPVISGSPPVSILRGQLYSFTPTASDPNGDTLAFSATGLPAWAGFDGGTGTLSGTSAVAGTFPGIVITVSDGQASASLPAFSIVVGNSPPVISGIPANTVLVDTAYGFVPTASDPESDPLTYSVAGLPVWASFNAANGAVTGTPQAGDVGVHAGISVTVSDGTASATIGPFSIQVLPRATGSALLSWLPPTQNVDGTLISNLDGFVIYWGTTPGSYPYSITVPNPGSTTYLVENLLPGTTYYFVTTAFNSLGLESDFSNVASKTIP
jgi:hypothetical protein